MSALDHYSDAKWPADFIDRMLWEVAISGGQVRRGYNSLVKAAVERHGEKAALDFPAERTVREWVQYRYRNRYNELLKQKAEELDERRAQDASTLSVQLRDAEERALAQTLAGLGDANGLEASMILRNLSQSKRMNSDVIVAARGLPALQTVGEGLMEIARGLSRLGGVTVVDQTGEEIVDANVVG
jgi:hypothetical protein